MNIQLIENGLRPEDFVTLRASVGFMQTPIHQAEKALEKGLFSIMAMDEDKVIGMGRLVGDGIMYSYIQDVCILPEYQGKGIGKAIIERLIAFVEMNGLPETKFSIGLVAAQGKDTFYEQFGFSKLPNDSMGSGMMKRIDLSIVTA